MKENEKYYKAKAIADALKNRVIENSTDEIDIQDWLCNNPYAADTIHKFTTEDSLNAMLEEYDSIKKNSLVDIEHLINNVIVREKRKRALKYKLLAGSIAVAILAVSMLVYNGNPEGKENTKKIAATVEEPLNKPYLVLNDGQKVDVTNVSETNLQINDVIDKTSHRLNYYARTNEAEQNKIEYHTLITPSAFTYSITLADGTEVTLNANSKLRYPVNFSNDCREVWLEGEAYFRVKKDHKPFTVISADVKTKVYGTEFNVQSFDNNVVKTILVEGSVSVQFKGGMKEKILKPNQMTTANSDSGNIVVSEVDVNRYTAWLTGCFRYDSEKIGDAINEFSRWYGVEFKFSNPEARDEIITALFEKSSSLEKILLTIEKATTLRFIKKGGYYIVK